MTEHLIAAGSDARLVEAMPGYRMSTAIADAGAARLGGGRLRFDADADLGEWVLTYDEVIVVLAGRLTVIADEHASEAGPGDAVVLRAGGRVRYLGTAGTEGIYVTSPRDAAPERPQP